MEFGNECGRFLFRQKPHKQLMLQGEAPPPLPPPPPIGNLLEMRGPRASEAARRDSRQHGDQLAFGLNVMGALLGRFEIQNRIYPLI